MRKLACSLLLAGLASGALAQSSVSMYGLLDSGLRVDRTSGGTLRSIAPGMGSGSRWGFRGTEDLGGGLKATFNLEGGFGVDTGASGQGGLLFGRRSVVGLGGGFGTVLLGREYAPAFYTALALDPFGYGTVGNVVNIYPRVPIRINNSFNYLSERFVGLEVRLVYGLGESNAAGVAKSAGDQLGASLNWTGGPVTAHYAYHEIKGAANVANTPKEKQHVIGGVFKFDPVKIYASYALFKNDAATTAPAYVKFGNYFLGVDATFGANVVIATYGAINDKAATNRDAKLMSLGYIYFLSRRTDLHATVARMTNNANAQNVITDSTNAGLMTTANVPLGYDPTAFGVGIRHRF